MITTDTPASIARVLRANSRFSVASGLLLVVGNPWLDDLLGPPSWLLAGVGAGVLAFGMLLARGAASRPVEAGRVAVLADLGWVAATVALAPVVAPSFTPTGGVVAWAVASAVAGFALAEWRALRT